MVGHITSDQSDSPFFFCSKTYSFIFAPPSNLGGLQDNTTLSFVIRSGFGASGASGTSLMENYNCYKNNKIKRKKKLTLLLFSCNWITWFTWLSCTSFIYCKYAEFIAITFSKVLSCEISI